jgi:predicted dithiol-disulfide oxidoreductase (DUF899 family)
VAHLHPEWAESLDLTDDARDRLAAEPRSKVTFEIEPLGDQVKLTVIHDDLKPGGETGSLISQGWSQLLVYHFMFGPEYTGGCPACSAIASTALPSTWSATTSG